MQSVAGITNVLLVISATCEVTRPERVLRISVRHNVVVFCGPGDVLFCDRINVHRGSRVNKLDVRLGHVVLIPEVDHVVKRDKAHFSIHVMEISAHQHEHVLLRQVMFNLVSDPIIDGLRTFWRIVSGKVLVDNEWGVVLICCGIEVKAVRRVVKVVQSVRHDLGTITECIVHWSLDPLHRLFG
jgi:hypothetical protein